MMAGLFEFKFAVLALSSVLLCIPQLHTHGLATEAIYMLLSCFPVHLVTILGTLKALLQVG